MAYVFLLIFSMIQIMSPLMAMGDEDDFPMTRDGTSTMEDFIAEFQKKPVVLYREPSMYFLYHGCVGDSVLLVPTQPWHGMAFINDFQNPTFMRYVGCGDTCTWDETLFQSKMEARDNLRCPNFINLNPVNPVSKFTWSVVTRFGIAGKIFISQSKDGDNGRLEIDFCVLSAFKKSNVAQEAIRLIMQFFEPSTLWLATAHPDDLERTNALLSIRDEDGVFVFYSGNVRENVYGPGQHRDYFRSYVSPPITWWSFYGDRYNRYNWFDFQG